MGSSMMNPETSGSLCHLTQSWRLLPHRADDDIGFRCISFFETVQRAPFRRESCAPSVNIRVRCGCQARQPERQP